MSAQINQHPEQAADLVRREGGSGFGPLLRKELQTWWGGRRWLVQGILWQLILNGLLAFFLFVIPALPVDDPALIDEDPILSGLQGFFAIGSLALAVGVILLSGDALTSEIQLGTAEWVMTKPISRRAFVLAKLAAHTIGMLVVLILLPGLVAYVLLTIAGGFSLLIFAAALAVMALHTFFYLALTLMMGTLTTNRSAVLGVALGTLLGGLVLLNVLAMSPVAFLVWVSPWILSQVTQVIAEGPPVPVAMLVPIAATAAWCALLVAIALWRFKRLEL